MTYASTAEFSWNTEMYVENACVIDAWRNTFALQHFARASPLARHHANSVLPCRRLLLPLIEAMVEHPLK